jgi:hypothetical protein
MSSTIITRALLVEAVLYKSEVKFKLIPLCTQNNCPLQLVKRKYENSY